MARALEWQPASRITTKATGQRTAGLMARVELIRRLSCITIMRSTHNRSGAPIKAPRGACSSAAARRSMPAFFSSVRTRRSNSGRRRSAANWRRHNRIGTAGDPPTVSPAGDMAGDTALRRHPDPVANPGMIRDPGLSAEFAPFADPGRTGNSGQRGKTRISSDFAVVPDMHQVVELDPAANPGAPHGRPVDSGIGADFDLPLDVPRCRSAEFWPAPPRPRRSRILPNRSRHRCAAPPGRQSRPFPESKPGCGK